MFGQKKTLIEHMATNYLIVLTLVAGLVAVLGPPLYGGIERFFERARNSEAVENAKAVYSAMKSFHEVYGSYPDRKEGVGFILEGKHSDFYVSRSELPEELKAIVPQSISYSDKNSFKVLVTLRRGSQTLKFWTVNNMKQIERLCLANDRRDYPWECDIEVKK